MGEPIETNWTARVLAAIESGHGTAGAITAEVWRTSRACEPMNKIYRHVDRALQGLRKSGRIRLVGRPRRWEAVAPTTIPGGRSRVDGEVG